jgi:hypothetical protein
MVWLDVPNEEYMAVREHPRRFVIAPAHEIPDVESIVERHPGYFVIEKPVEVEPVLRR